MEEKLYLISEVSKMVGVEPHVLRYWEEELQLKILRNRQGKRCYTQEDVDQLCRIKYWKDKGMQLKAVKELLGKEFRENEWLEKEMSEKEPEDDSEPVTGELITIEEPPDSIKRFAQILDGIIGQALEKNNEKLVREICDTILQELDDRLEDRMEELLQKELLQEMIQEGVREAAAAKSGRKRREGIWKRWKQWLERCIGT